MTPKEYLAALKAAGISLSLPFMLLDMEAARLLSVDTRTARRYRRGEVSIPRPVQALLAALAKPPKR